MRTLRTLLAALALSCAAPLPGAAAPATPPTPTYSDLTEVSAVEIPVQVLQDGKPVRGLTAADFVVYQEKTKQEITGFDVVDLYGAAPTPDAPAPAAAVPAPARRHFLFLFDLSFSEPKAIVQARDAAKTLLTDLHASDLAAVATYSASHGSELVIGFTSDRSQVQAAIDTLGLPELVDRTTTDPLRLIVEDLRLEMREADIPGSSGAIENRAGFKTIVLDRLEGFLRDSERATLENEKDKVSAMTRSMTDLARLLRGVSGRKHVIYLSQGYDGSMLTGSTDETSKAEMRDAGNRGEVWKVDGERRFGSAGLAGDVESMLRELRRADCIVQAVDIGGLSATVGSRGGLGFERKNGRDSLFQMAHDTGGDLYENFNDLGAAMGQMLERTGVTYVLTIQPSVPADGAYRTLRVELKRGIPDSRNMRVVSRPGYYAPRPYAQRSRYEKMMATAGEVLLGAEGGPVRLSVLAAPMAAPGGASAASTTADVPVRIEISGASLLHLNQGGDLPTEIYVYAFDGQGQVRDFLAQALTLDLFKVEARLLESGLRFYGHLELPPGSYTARVLVRNGRTGLHGLKVVPLVVPALTAASLPATLPAIFSNNPDAAGSWLVTREAPRPGRREIPFPARP